MTTFHVCTIVNDLVRYDAMCSSFLAAGFDEARCRYTMYDNTRGNLHEPYKTCREAVGSTTETFLIFCHQDVVLERGHGYEHLCAVLAQLEQQDPRWAVAGNAGSNFSFELVLWLTGARENFHGKPVRVQSLDENLLIIKPSAGIACSNALSGFHLYGTDLCLQAILSGWTCYVVDFHLHHLSSGNLGPEFWEMVERFKAHWRKNFIAAYLRTPCVIFSLSRWDRVDRLLSRNFFLRRTMIWWWYRWLASLELRIRGRLASRRRRTHPSTLSSNSVS